MKKILKKIVALTAIACMLISSVTVNAATKNYSQTALSKTSVKKEPGAVGFVALRNVKGDVKWSSNNTSVVQLVYKTSYYERPYTGKISEVDFQCKKEGTSKITATYNGKKYICTVTVKKGAVTAPKFEKSSVTVSRGKSVVLKVTGMDRESSYAKYTSSHSKIADVNPSYDTRENIVEVEGLKKGTTYINCMIDGIYKLKCKVTVK